MKAIASCYPVHGLRTMDEVFDQIFGGSARSGGARFDLGQSKLPIDLVDSAEAVTIRAAVPGVKPENISVTVEKDVLTIKGSYESATESESETVYRREMASGSFDRSVRLPQNVNAEAIEANFENGVLKVRIPRLPEEQPKNVKVNVVSGEANAS